MEDKMRSAKAYVQDGQIDKARKILKSIHHPTAEKWLKQLDEKHPPKPFLRRFWVQAMLFLTSAILIYATWFVLVEVPKEDVRFARTSFILWCAKYHNDKFETPSGCGDLSSDLYYTSKIDQIMDKCVYSGETIGSMSAKYDSTLFACMRDEGIIDL